MKNSQEYKEARHKAHREYTQSSHVGGAHYHGFDAGFDFAMAQPKHIFDGVAQVGEVRRFEGELVDVVSIKTCSDCALLRYDIDCGFFTGCDIHNVKYIKRA